MLNALLSVVSHDRLDLDVDLDSDQVAAADEMLAEDVDAGSLDSGGRPAQWRAARRTRP